MLHAEEPVLHLTHPEPVPWSSVLQYFAKELDLPVAPYKEWLADLRKAHAKLNAGRLTPTEVEGIFQENPALRLIEFFEAAEATAMKDSLEPLNVPKLDVTKALKAAPSLKKAEQVAHERVQRWIQFWRKTGFLA